MADNYCVIHRVEHNISKSYRVVDSLSLKIMACYATKTSACREAERLNREIDNTHFIVVEHNPEVEAR